MKSENERSDSSSIFRAWAFSGEKPSPRLRLLARLRRVFLGISLIAAAGSAQPARLANLSTRGEVGVGADNIFGGFVISGGPKIVLVRAIGPGLAAFGVPGTLSDPKLTIFDSKNAAIASNDDWKASDAVRFAEVDAFPLPDGSKDAVVFATLPPGAYTAQISGSGSAGNGVALFEVHWKPPAALRIFPITVYRHAAAAAEKQKLALGGRAPASSRAR